MELSCIKSNHFEMPRNLVIDSFNELKLKRAIDLNEVDVLLSFESFATIHSNLLSKGIQPSFDLVEKEKAKNYLLGLCIKKYK